MEPQKASDAPPSLVGPQHLAEMVARARATPPGCFVEVGVYKGGSAWHLYQLALEQRRELHLYDTFTGIPHADEGDSHKVGDFADTTYYSVRQRFPEAYVTMCVFPDQVRHERMPPVAFAHLDCDQYRSVRDSALYLLPYMVDCGVILFDDSPCIPAARRAAEEIFGSDLQLSPEGKHFVVINGGGTQR